MRTLICYASKSGTARDCAEKLASFIPDSTVVNLKKDKPDPAEYDQVIVGGSIRMAVAHVDMRQYLDLFKHALLEKKLGIFLCAANDEQKNVLFENNIDPDLREHAVCVECFGGEVRLDKLRGFEKLTMKMVYKKHGGEDMPKLFPERIEAFSKLFCE